MGAIGRMQRRIAKAGAKAAAGKRKQAAYLVNSASPEEIARGIRASRAQREYAARIAAMVTAPSRVEERFEETIQLPLADLPESPLSRLGALSHLLTAAGALSHLLTAAEGSRCEVCADQQGEEALALLNTARDPSVVAVDDSSAIAARIREILRRDHPEALVINARDLLVKREVDRCPICFAPLGGGHHDPSCLHSGPVVPSECPGVIGRAMADVLKREKP